MDNFLAQKKLSHFTKCTNFPETIKNNQPNKKKKNIYHIHMLLCKLNKWMALDLYLNWLLSLLNKANNFYILLEVIIKYILAIISIQ